MFQAHCERCFDFSFHSISFFILSLVILLFLLPDNFYFLNVVDKYHNSSTSCACRLRRDCVASFHDEASGWLPPSWSLRYGLVRDVDTRKICKASSPTLVGECCLVCSFWSRRSPQVWIWEVSQLGGWVFSGASVLSCTVHSGMVAIVVCSCRGLGGRRFRWSIMCVCGSTLWVLATSLCVFWRWNPSIVLASAWTLFLPAVWFVHSLLCHPYMFWSFRPIGCDQKRPKLRDLSEDQNYKGP